MKLLFKTVAFAALMFMISCGGGDSKGSDSSYDWRTDKGVGPISSVEVGDGLDQALVSQGQKFFTQKCTACHKPDEKYIGPALKGVANERTPEWIMNMIMNPERMIKENEAAKQLFEEYMTPMSDQNVSENEARALLEYIRSLSM